MNERGRWVEESTERVVGSCVVVSLTPVIAILSSHVSISGSTLHSGSARSRRVEVGTTTQRVIRA